MNRPDIMLPSPMMVKLHASDEKFGEDWRPGEQQFCAGADDRVGNKKITIPITIRTSPAMISQIPKGLKCNLLIASRKMLLVRNNPLPPEVKNRRRASMNETEPRYGASGLYCETQPGQKHGHPAEEMPFLREEVRGSPDGRGDDQQPEAGGLRGEAAEFDEPGDGQEYFLRRAAP